MKRDDDKPKSAEVANPDLIAQPLSVRSSPVAPPSPGEPSSSGEKPAEVPPAAESTVAKTIRLARTIRRVVGIIGLVMTVLIFAARSRMFGAGLGKSVLRAEDCRSGKLLQSRGVGLGIGGICTKDCSADGECGGALHCREGSCAPIGTGAVGASCSAPWDCQSELCIATQSPGLGLFGPAPTPDESLPQAMCSQRCDDQTGCPTGFDCAVDPLENQSYCVKHGQASSLLDLIRKAHHGGDAPSGPSRPAVGPPRQGSAPMVGSAGVAGKVRPSPHPGGEC